MKRIRGTIRNNVVVLEDGVYLPEGTEVKVLTRVEKREQRANAFQRIRKNPIKRFVGIDEIIEDDKDERERRTENGKATGR
jgi:hypothetical protein